MEQVKQSVNRRTDYIMQTLRNNQVKDNQYKVHKIISHTDEGLYKMSSEVVIEFNNVSKKHTKKLLISWLKNLKTVFKYQIRYFIIHLAN